LDTLVFTMAIHALFIPLGGQIRDRRPARGAPNRRQYGRCPGHPQGQGSRLQGQLQGDILRRHGEGEGEGHASICSISVRRILQMDPSRLCDPWIFPLCLNRCFLSEHQLTMLVFSLSSVYVPSCQALRSSHTVTLRISMIEKRFNNKLGSPTPPPPHRSTTCSPWSTPSCSVITRHSTRA